MWCCLLLFVSDLSYFVVSGRSCYVITALLSLFTCVCVIHWIDFKAKRTLLRFSLGISSTLCSFWKRTTFKRLRTYVFFLRDYTFSFFPVFPGPENIKSFSCSTQLSMNLSLLINMKIPTIVSVFIFISRENSIISYI